MYVKPCCYQYLLCNNTKIQNKQETNLQIQILKTEYLSNGRKSEKLNIKGQPCY